MDCGFPLNLFPPARNLIMMTDAAARIYERVLILRCQAGDEAALAELIARHSPGLRFFLKKIAAESADDLVQETWFDVYRKINALQQPDAFAAWLYRIARDKAYRQMRRRPTPTARIDESTTAAASFDEDTFDAEELAQMKAALDALPQDQREVLVLRFIEGMSYEQIAAIIDCPLGTVRSRIHYAKSAIREKLKRTTDKET
jgi:RNA polymerase sigma-70 factor (ECF subfamily)